MTSPFEVDHATLHNAANDVRSTRDEVEGELKRLQGEVQNLSAAWQGQASLGFQRVMERWTADTQKLQNALNDIADLLDKSGTAHQVTDDEQSQMMDKFQSALNP